MADKKREKKGTLLQKELLKMKHPQNFDDVVDNIIAQTLESIVEAETYPRGKNYHPENDGTQIYHSQRDRERYEQDPYTVAQHMADRTRFRH
ncbi:MAG: hypothetical protein E7484_00860 [Ruminococcaceae bacterium]|nr:hypothetical protein [Oscillospiraceae bacterium]